MADTFYVTTPIYYVNARPHIGHAYTTIVADVLARRHRLLGDDVWFLTGTDEHGQKIERSAAAAGVEPQAFADEVSASFSSLWKRMGITNDQFIRTTDAAHQVGVQKLFLQLWDAGKIYLSSYTGQYCVSEEMFVEGPPGTIGPDGKPTETVTEENFFFRLGEYQLPLLELLESDGLRLTPESRKNEMLSFLRGPVGQVDASELRTTGGGLTYIPGALKDLSVSRSSFTWGIPVPESAASEAKEKHVIYVWLDALANYMTALGYGSDDVSRFEKFWPANLHLVGKEIIRQHCIYWPAFLMAAGLPLPRAVTAHGWLLFEDSKMSKSKGNIVRTETILDGFGGLLPEGTSQEERDLFGADVLRYFLLREIPFGQDGSFSFDALVTRYNADLANGYGNLVSRVLSLIAQSSGGVIEDCEEAHSLTYWEPGMGETIGASEGQLLGWRADELVRVTDVAFSDNAFSEALTLVMSFLGLTDKFITSRKPWAATETDLSQQGKRATLYVASEAIRLITAVLYPVLPFVTAKVWRQLGLGDIATADLTNLEWGGLQPGTKLGVLSPVFPRADKKLAETMAQMEQDKNAPMGNANAAHDSGTQEPTEFVETAIASASGRVSDKKALSKLVDETTGHTAITNPVGFDPAAGPRTSDLSEVNPGAQVGGSSAATTVRPGTPSHVDAEPSGVFASAAAQVPVASGLNASGPADASPQITIDDFAKVELRVAKVMVCERIPKADKLLRLEVDLGYETRQILSGIAEWYTPEDLLGRRIVVITNLAPRKMRGLESHGMLLAASSEGGKPALATFQDLDELPLGSRLK